MNYIQGNPNIIPDDKHVNLRLYVLDPLSVIIKLAILSNKPIGTKIRIDTNTILFQEPGPFQALCRYLYKSNKTDIQHLYNPIEIACIKYLNKQSTQQNPRIKDLFQCAQHGILKLSETYKNCSFMRICLNYFFSLIDNHLNDTHMETLFRQDVMTPFYDPVLLDKLTKIWTLEKINIVLNLTAFLSNDDSAETNVKSLETIMNGIDRLVNQTIA